MIYVEHDFYMNLAEAVNSNDERLIKDIFRHELATLVAKERKELRRLFDVCGIAYKKGVSNEALTKSVLGNIRRGDSKFTTGIAVLIARQEGLINAVEKEKERNENKPKQSDIVSKIALSMRMFFDNLDKDDYLKFRNSVVKKANGMNKKYSNAVGATTRPSQSQLDAQRKAKRKKMIMVGVGIAVVVLGVIAYKKGWLAKLGIGGQKMSDGGTVTSGTTITPPAPISQTPPVVSTAPAQAPTAPPPNM
jgi:hypothetical protein